MSYELCVTAVSERADLFARAAESLLENVDVRPARLVVHEDVRCDAVGWPVAEPGEIASCLRRLDVPFEHRVATPAVGLGAAMRWCFEQAATPVVLYTQEDYGAARAIPVRRALEVVAAGNLNHVRFNQRNTLPCKHGGKGRNPEAWRKVEVVVDGQVLCVSDHWYTQTSLWRVAPALEGIREVLDHETVSDGNQFVARFNRRMNSRCGDGRPWNDQAMRHELLRTYIWGPVGEPAFLTSLDHDASRTTGPARQRRT